MRRILHSSIYFTNNLKCCGTWEKHKECVFRIFDGFFNLYNCGVYGLLCIYSLKLWNIILFNIKVYFLFKRNNRTKFLKYVFIRWNSCYSYPNFNLCIIIVFLSIGQSFLENCAFHPLFFCLFYPKIGSIIGVAASISGFFMIYVVPVITYLKMQRLEIENPLLAAAL